LTRVVEWQVQEQDFRQLDVKKAVLKQTISGFEFSSRSSELAERATSASFDDDDVIVLVEDSDGEGDR
jgi:hypothetical protein